MKGFFWHLHVVSTANLWTWRRVPGRRIPRNRMKIRKKNPETNEIKIQNKGFFYVPHFHSFHSSSHIESKKSIFDVYNPKTYHGSVHLFHFFIFISTFSFFRLFIPRFPRHRLLSYDESIHRRFMIRDSIR
jgi:hypothetical protein